jgi:hypothetical protein
LGEQDIEVLKALPISDKQDGASFVEVPVADSLLRLMTLKDELMAAVLGPAEQAVLNFVVMTDVGIPWFRFLHSLESYGVISGVRESQNSADMLTTWRPAIRELEVDSDQIANYARSQPVYTENALRIINAGLLVDADAESLLPYFQKEEPKPEEPKKEEPEVDPQKYKDFLISDVVKPK